jgi:hypothetical protein
MKRDRSFDEYQSGGIVRGVENTQLGDQSLNYISISDNTYPCPLSRILRNIEQYKKVVSK